MCKLDKVLVFVKIIVNLGGDTEEETPGPIPNPEVKLLKADDTASARGWESR